MAHRKPKYDAEVRYEGKLMGRCTVADRDGYEVLMQSCNHNAARVLQEYAYFSPELRGILEKVAAVQQAEQSRSTGAGLFKSPKTSPWGEVQTCDTIMPGVFLVSTAGHGGAMVAKDIAAILSPAARKCGFRMDEYLCFEEDSQEAVVLRELMDKGLWTPTHTTDRAGFEKRLNESIREYNPDYWKARQAGLERAAPRRAAPAHAHAER